MTGGRTSRLLLALVSMAVAALMAAQPLSAASLTSVVTDPVGDASTIAPGIVAAAYQDITKASVTLKDGRFIFVMDMAARIPSKPTLPSGAMLLEWSIELDTDPTTFPTGFPFVQATATPVEYLVTILWDGTSFSGGLIDRRPSLTGGEAVVTPISFTIKGAEITASVDASKIAQSGSFMWIVITRIWTTPLGTLGFFPVDAAPPCCNPAIWPS